MSVDYDKLPKNLVEKIQKLLRLQESAKSIGNIEEAANAAQKISDILMKYNLDMNDVTSADYTEKPSIIEAEFDTMTLENSHEGGWVLNLTKVVARANMCRILVSSRDKAKVWIVGTSVNAHTVWFIVEQLVNRLRPIASEEWRKYTGYEKRNTWKRGFFSGAVIGIGEQFMRIDRENREKARATEVNIQIGMRTEEQQTGVMIVKMQDSENARLDEYMSKFRKTTQTKRGTSSVGGKATGYATGSSMNVRSGLTSGAKRLN